MARKGVADGQQIAMEVCRRFRLAGCSGTESNQRNVVLCRSDIREPGGLIGEPWRKFVTARSVVEDDFPEDRRSRLRVLEFLRKFLSAQRIADLRLRDNGGQVLRAKLGHGGNRDAAGLEDSKPARRQHGRICIAQQNALSRYESPAL